MNSVHKHWCWEWYRLRTPRDVELPSGLTAKLEGLPMYAKEGTLSTQGLVYYSWAGDGLLKALVGFQRTPPHETF